MHSTLERMKDFCLILNDVMDFQLKITDVKCQEKGVVYLLN